MQIRLSIVGVLLMLVGCGDPEPAAESEPFNGTVTFFIAPAATTPDKPGLLAATSMAFLAVEKEGLPQFVDAWQDATPDGARHGRHNFPTGTSAVAIAGYYGAALENAGWKPNVDFKAGSGSVHLYGVRSLKAGSAAPDLQVSVTP